MNVETWVRFFILASVVPVTLFALLYGLRSPWRASWTGRWLMMQSTALAGVLWLVVSATWFGDWPGRQWVRLFVYGFLFLSFCGGCAVLAYQQQAAPRRHRREHIEA